MKPVKKFSSVVVTASEDTLIGLWTGYSIIFKDSVHGPLETQTGIRGTSPAKALYNDETGTYRAFTHTGDVEDWREGREGRIYRGDAKEYPIKLVDPKRSEHD
jgi:hypothetical protein